MLSTDNMGSGAIHIIVRMLYGRSYLSAGQATAEASGTDDRERTGSYVLQAADYRAFIPASLPPRPLIRMMGTIQALLSAADRALGRLDGAIYTSPEVDLFVPMYIRKEAVLSNQIEGTQSSLRDVLAVEARLLPPRGTGALAK